MYKKRTSLRFVQLISDDEWAKPDKSSALTCSIVVELWIISTTSAVLSFEVFRFFVVCFLNRKMSMCPFGKRWTVFFSLLFNLRQGHEEPVPLSRFAYVFWCVCVCVSDPNFFILLTNVGRLKELCQCLSGFFGMVPRNRCFLLKRSDGLVGRLKLMLLSWAD